MVWKLGGLAAAALVFASSCGPAQTPSADPTATSPEVRPTTSHPVAPDAVCRRLAVTYMSVDTRHDTGPADARQRAAQNYGTPALRRQLDGGGSGRGSRFTRWARHDGHVEITNIRAVRDDPPPTTGGHTAAGFVLSGHVAGTGQWRQPYGPVAVYCSLDKRPAGWRVDHVQVSQGQP